MGPCQSSQNEEEKSSWPKDFSPEESIKFFVEKNGGETDDEIKWDEIVEIFKSKTWDNYLRGRKCMQPRNIKHVIFKLDWSDVRIVPKETDDMWTEINEKFRTVSRNIFCSVFTNKSDNKQTHSLKADRQTITTFKGSLVRGKTSGVNLGLSVAAPQKIAQASASYSSGITFTTTDETTKETAITWSVEGQITVKPNSELTAEAIVTEEHYEYNLKARAFVTGEVIVNIYKKSSNQRLFTGGHYVNQILTEAKNIKEQDCVMIIKGTCIWNLGTRQRTEVSECEISSKGKQNCVDLKEISLEDSDVKEIRQITEN